MLRFTRLTCAVLALFALPAMADPVDAPAAPAAPAPAAWLLDKSVAMSRCTSAELLACLELDEASCKSAMSEAADSANAGVTAEAAKEPLTPMREGYLQGLAMGKFMGAMIGKTKGKFYTCMKKR